MKYTVIIFPFLFSILVSAQSSFDVLNQTYWLNKQVIKYYKNLQFDQARETCQQALNLPANENQDYTHFLLGVVGKNNFEELRTEEQKQHDYEYRRLQLLQSGFLIKEPMNDLYSDTGFLPVIEESLAPVLDYTPSIKLDTWRDIYVMYGRVSNMTNRTSDTYILLKDFIDRWVTPELNQNYPTSVGELYYAFATTLDNMYTNTKISWLDSAEHYAEIADNQVFYATGNLYADRAELYYNDWQYEKAYQEAKKGVYWHTDSLYNKYTSNDSTDYHANVLLVKAAYFTERYEEALQYANEFLQHHDDFSRMIKPEDQILLYKVWTLEKLNRFEEAEQAITEVIEYEDRFSFNFGYGQRGWIRTVLGKYDLAKQDYTKDFENDSAKVSFALEGRGRVLYLEENFEKALADFKQGLQVGSAQGYDKYTIVWQYFTQLNLGDSKQKAQQELKANWNYLENKRPLYIDYVIDVILGFISEEEALEAIETFKGIDSHANEAVGYFYLGMWHRQEGRRDKAKQYFQQAKATKQYGLVPYQFAKKLLEKM